MVAPVSIIVVLLGAVVLVWHVRSKRKKQNAELVRKVGQPTSSKLTYSANDDDGPEEIRVDGSFQRSHSRRRAHVHGRSTS